MVVEGYVAGEPDVRGADTRLDVAAWSVVADGAASGDTDSATVRGRALVDVARYCTFEYGDRVRVSGRLEAPPELDGFDYREYLAARGVDSLLRDATVQRLDGRAGSGLLRLIFRCKAAIQHSIEAVLPHPEAGLLAGILLGIDHTLPEDLMEAFRAVGLVHIIVISGYNIGLVAQAILVGAGRWLHRWAALGVGLGAITLFTMMVGPTPPVLRAALMAGGGDPGRTVGPPGPGVGESGRRLYHHDGLESTSLGRCQLPAFLCRHIGADPGGAAPGGPDPCLAGPAWRLRRESPESAFLGARAF